MSDYKRELHIHSCFLCPADFLSPYIKLTPGTNLCARCLEKTYKEAKRSSELHGELYKYLHKDKPSKRKPAK